MSLDIFVHFGLTKKFPSDQWDKFIETVPKMKGIDNIHIRTDFDLNNVSDEYGIARIFFAIAQESEENEVLYFKSHGAFNIELLTKFIGVDDDRVADRNWVLFVTNSGGGEANYWATLFALPAIAFKTLPDAIIIDSMGDHYDDLQNYLIWSGKRLCDIVGEDKAIASGFVSVEKVLLYERVFRDKAGRSLRGREA